MDWVFAWLRQVCDCLVPEGTAEAVGGATARKHLQDGGAASRSLSVTSFSGAPEARDAFPEETGAILKHLANAQRVWTAAQCEEDGEKAEKCFEKMEALKRDLEGTGSLSADTCQQIHDMAVSATELSLCRIMGKEGLEDREEMWNDACQPKLEEVSESLWRRLRKLFLAAAALGCAEVKEDEAESAKQQRLYDRHARALVGMGRVGDAQDQDMDEFSTRAKGVIPATVVMFSGCKDHQTSADVHNTSSFGLPEDAGPGGAGGACTSAMLKALEESEEEQVTWVSLLKAMREILDGNYTQIPMLSSSRMMDLHSQFSVMNAEPSGNCRALLIGINYVGTKQELRGCHNDVFRMQNYLEGAGYSTDSMRLLLDDGEHEEPTRANIVDAFEWLVEGAAAGDSLFLHYSGHGASVKDDESEEQDGKDEALVPLDYKTVGLLRDDDTYQHLVAPLQEGAWLTCVMDCCHSGSIIDLPYTFQADAQGLEAVANGGGMTANPDFDFGKLQQVLKNHPLLSVVAYPVMGLAFFTGGPERAAAVGSKIMSFFS